MHAAALGEELDPQEDQQASAAMRRHLAKVLLVRCVSALLGRPELNAGGSRACNRPAEVVDLRRRVSSRSIK